MKLSFPRVWTNCEGLFPTDSKRSISWDESFWVHDRTFTVNVLLIPIILENERHTFSLNLRLNESIYFNFHSYFIDSRKRIPGPGVSPALGVRPSNGFGVAATLCRGVTPEKSEAWTIGLAPPYNGVCPAWSLARFWASIVMWSSPLAPMTWGVRIGVANLQGSPLFFLIFNKISLSSLLEARWLARLQINQALLWIMRVVYEGEKV